MISIEDRRDAQRASDTPGQRVEGECQTRAARCCGRYNELMSSSTLKPTPVEPRVAIEQLEQLAAPPNPVSREEIAAWGLLAALLTFVLFRHLVGGIIAAMALYLILDGVSTFFARRLSRGTARPLALLLVTLVGGGAIVGAVALAITFMRHHAGNIPALMNKMAEILESTRAWLGGYGDQFIPEVMTDAENFKIGVVAWLKEHAETLKVAGGNLSRALLHVLMGLLLAILIFLRHVTHAHESHEGPLSYFLTQKMDRFAAAFRRIATAQIKISVVNTTLTAAYLFVLLPLFGVQLPFATTIVLITFLCGLIPVLGNLISNTVIVVLSMGISEATAISSLVFLVVVHKLEYLLNSRIVGGETDSQAWEILMAILIGEASFGVAGIVIAPIVYAFVKGELRERGLV
jgi:predicted PurR-regulated permease PerM